MTRKEFSKGGAAGNPRAAGGMTLVELLVVMLIVVILTAVTVPMLKPVLDRRQLREAARMVSTLLGSAQTKAVTTGRSFGVWIQPMRVDGLSDTSGNHDRTQFSMDLYLCEAPPLYCGDTTNSRVQIGMDTNGLPQITGFTPASDDILHNGKIQIGDLIRFNYTGPWYHIGNPTNGTYTYVPSNFWYPERVFMNSPNGGAPWSLMPVVNFWLKATGAAVDPGLTPLAATPAGSNGVPYEIKRHPVRTLDPPLQLPTGAGIDMNLSNWFGTTGGAASGGTNGRGVGSTAIYDWNGSNPPQWIRPGDSFYPEPVIVMFAPDGSFEQLYYLNSTSSTSTPPAPPNFYSQYEFYGHIPFAPFSMLIGHTDKLFINDSAGGVAASDLNVALQNAGFSHQAGELNVTNPTNQKLSTREMAIHHGNIYDPDCYWVTVYPTGGVAVAEAGAPTVSFDQSGNPADTLINYWRWAANSQAFISRTDPTGGR